jgi:pimeloyl-ACP methyl ester carboxylesterase
MSSDHECFIFVHGALCGAWCWEDVLAQLASMGISAHAVDLPGHGQNRHLNPTSHKDYVDYLNSFILEKDLRNVVLVGHSMGGSVIPYTAMALKDRISRLIFYTTVFPETGKTVLSVAPAFLEYCCKLFLSFSGFKSLSLPRCLLRIIFCNDMDKTAAHKLLSQIGPQPARPITTSFPEVNITAFQCLYILARRDLAIFPRKQQRILRNIPNCRVESLDTGHFGMMSQPDNLVRLLVDGGAS